MGEERRVVTVLFADVADSTRLGSTSDPEDVRALMARYYEEARSVIGEHGGTLEKFIGDAVMAIFGMPRAHGDDAARALAAAGAIRDRLRNDADLSPLNVRFGVATGEVVAARDSSGGDFLISGDPVNIAARLQQTAEPWEIVATERTAWDARAAFQFGPARNVELKGRDVPVTVRALKGPIDIPRTMAALPFVGRVDELNQLSLSARRAFRERTPAVMSIVAPAGTGKTRLVHEFLSGPLRHLAPTAMVEIAQCLPYGRQLTYWPLRALLFGIVGIDDAVAAPHLVDAIESWLGDRRDAELLAATIGAEHAASADPTELFAAWRSAIAKAAAVRPLVVVFEDLHWSSDSLLDLVEFVMDPRETGPVLTIAIARPELIDRRPTWGGGRRNFVSIYLDPLPDAETAALVAPILEGSPPTVVHEVVRRSEGNPFFASELAQAATERSGIELPDTVQATMLARLDLLQEDQRRLLQVASIFGRSFRREGLLAIAPELGSRQSELIDALMSRDLLRKQDADHVMFRHILIREVAYSTLSRAERSRLHGAAAGWLEGRAAGRQDEVAELVAFHLKEALANVGALAPANPELKRRAATWLLRAADTAIGAAATREAEAHLRAALELLDDPDELADVWSRLGEVLRVLPGGYEAYVHAARIARQPERRLAALSGLLTSGTRYVTVHFAAPEIEAAIVEGEGLVPVVNNVRLEALFLTGVGFQPNWALQHDTSLDETSLRRAEASAKRAVMLAESLDEPNLASAALDALSSSAMYSSNWEVVRQTAEKRRAYGPRLSLAEIMDADHMATWANMMLGEPHAAERVNNEALGRLRPSGALEWQLSILCWRIRIQYTLGRWSEGMETVDQALGVWRQLGKPAVGWASLGFRPGLLMARGRHDQTRGQSVIDALRPTKEREGPSRAAYDTALMDDDLSAMAAAVSGLRRVGFGPMLAADALRQLLDAGYDCSGLVMTLLEIDRKLPILEPQVLRAVGLASRDAALLRSALELARRFFDVPTAARLSVELGRLLVDPSLVEDGRSQLLAMGDLRQLERYDLT